MVNDSKSAFTLAEVLITLVIIGVVAALTIPTAISKFRKNQIETRLKKSYSTLTNAIKRAEVDHGSVSLLWDTSNLADFINTYIKPYVSNIKKITVTSSWINLYLGDGTMWIIKKNAGIQFVIDINGDSKPNNNGYDRFSFYLLRAAAAYHNAGDGDVAWNTPTAGVYYDGYGMPKNYLINSQWRGCSDSCTYGHARSYCSALIVRNGWKIPDDYPLNL